MSFSYFRRIPWLVLGLILCWLPLISRAADYLPPEQAFPFDAQMVNEQSATPSVRVVFSIAPDYYMYRDEFAFTVVSPDGRVTQNGGVKMPPAQHKFDEAYGKEVAYYHNTVVLNVPLRVNGTGEAAFKLVVASRGCSDKGLCYPPRKNQVVLRSTPNANVAVNANQSSAKESVANNTPVPVKKSTTSANEKSAEEVEIKPLNSIAPLETANENSVNGNPNGVVINATPSTNSIDAAANKVTLDNSQSVGALFAQKHIFWALASVFGLGLLLSLTPCMFPMFPILTVILAGQSARGSRARGFALAFSYVSGMALVYALVGIIAARTGVALQSYLQSPWVLGGFALLLAMMALSMFDVFQLQMPQGWQNWLQTRTQGKRGYSGALLMGAASALIASPCVTAPLVGLISYIAHTGQVALGGLALLVLAYGMGVPLLLLGAGLGQWLPKAGAWMTRVKALIGVLMLAVAVWVAQPLWQPLLQPYWQRLTHNPAQNISMHASFERVSSVQEIQTIVRSSDRPVLIDLYANWCRACVEMEQKIFSDPRVRAEFASMRLLRVDMTKNTAQDTEILKYFGLYGPPGIMVLEAQSGREKGRVVGFEAPEAFLAHIQQMR